jgi:hypothetical protein
MKEMVSRKELVVVFGRAFSRPPRLMFGNPVALIFSIYYAYLYGIIYVFLVSAPLLFGAPPFVVPSLFHYNWPQYTLGFSYTGLAIGFFLAAATAAICSDRIYQYLSRKHGNDGEPEYRIIICQLGMFIMPAGLFMYGWTAHAEVHWMAPMVAMALVSYGLMVAFSSIQNFLVDAFFPYSAAAIAGATAVCWQGERA